MISKASAITSYAKYLNRVFLLVVSVVLMGCQDKGSSSEDSSAETVSHHIVKKVEYSEPVAVSYNSTAWEDIHKVHFDFGAQAIEQPQSLVVNIELTEPLTQPQYFSGVIKEQSPAKGIEVTQGNLITLDLNDAAYLDSVRKGRVTLGIGRTEAAQNGNVKRIQKRIQDVNIKRITATLVAKPVEAEKGGEEIMVDASHYVLGHERFKYALEPSVTYELSLSGKAFDEQGREFNGLQVRYFDSLSQQWTVKQLGMQEPMLVNTTGLVEFFVTGRQESNQGSYTVNIQSVNLG